MDTTTPTGRLVANVMASVAEWERAVIGERTAAGVAAAKAKGRLPGRRSGVLPSVQARLLAERQAGWTLRSIADGLNADGLLTRPVWPGRRGASRGRSGRLGWNAKPGR